MLRVAGGDVRECRVPFIGLEFERRQHFLFERVGQFGERAQVVGVGGPSAMRRIIGPGRGRGNRVAACSSAVTGDAGPETTLRAGQRRPRRPRDQFCLTPPTNNGGVVTVGRAPIAGSA